MTADVPAPVTELALWCARLPELREQAQAAGVTERLDRDVARVRDGGSVHRAVRKWLQDESPGTVRSWSGRNDVSMVGFPGAATRPVVSAGAYACPADRCGRTAERDADGHTPVCHAFGTVMRPAE